MALGPAAIANPRGEGHPRSIPAGKHEEVERDSGSASEARWSDWMARGNAGDAKAYHQLLEDVSGAMEVYLRRRFGDADFVEDCVQESLLAIHRARESYDPRRSFRAWMFTIVRHKAIDLLRRRGTRERLERSGHPIEDTAAERLTDAVEAAQLLNALSPEYRDALVLTKLQGYTLGAAARRAGISTTAMKSRVHRALRQVRAVLQRDED